MDSVTAPRTGRRALVPRPEAAQGRDDPDPQRRRARPDAVHRPHDRSRQHLALEARAACLRAGRARRRRLRHAELRADQGPAADDRQAARARPAARPARRAGATARACCAGRSCCGANGAGDDPPGRAPEHLPAGHHHAERPARASATRSTSTAQDQGGRRLGGGHRGPRHGHRHAVRQGLDRPRRHARGRQRDGTFRLLFREGLGHRARSTCRSRSRAARSTSTAPPASPAAPAPTAASRAARSRPTTTTRSTGRTAS